MKIIKTYELDGLTYGFNLNRNRKWLFQKNNFGITVECPKGVETAHKVAGIVNGSLKRTKGEGMDNLGRKSLEMLFERVKNN